MPPRYAYWTILAGGLPTAFRAAEREELLPTFKRIQEKHPDAEMKYFARGRLWGSAEEVRAADAQVRERRSRDWRPGGDHRDPRQKFADAKKDRNQRWRKEKHEHKQRVEGRNQPPREKPHGDPLAKKAFTPRPGGAGQRPRWTNTERAKKSTFSRDAGARPPARPEFKRDGRRPDVRGKGGSLPPKPRETRSDGGTRPPKRPPFKREGEWRAKPRPPYRKPGKDDDSKDRRRS